MVARYYFRKILEESTKLYRRGYSPAQVVRETSRKIPLTLGVP